MKINTVVLVLKTDKPLTCSSSKFRGFIGNQFKDHYLLHNHFGGQNLIYNYPLVQYQIIGGQATILGIESGAETLKKISSDLDYLNADKRYSIEEKILYEKSYNVQPTMEEYHYKFITPWLGLNTHNFQKYIKMKGWKEKKIFLNKILVGNILSMSKGLGIIVNKRLHITSRLDETIVEYKGVNMKAFTGEFKVHYRIPDFFGFGKGVSQGFGTIKMISDDNGNLR